MEKDDLRWHFARDRASRSLNGRSGILYPAQAGHGRYGSKFRLGCAGPCKADSA
jgi:hypothetical protein